MRELEALSHLLPIELGIQPAHVRENAPRLLVALHQLQVAEKLLRFRPGVRDRSEHHSRLATAASTASIPAAPCSLLVRGFLGVLFLFSNELLVGTLRDDASTGIVEDGLAVLPSSGARQGMQQTLSTDRASLRGAPKQFQYRS